MIVCLNPPHYPRGYPVSSSAQEWLHPAQRSKPDIIFSVKRSLKEKKSQSFVKVFSPWLPLGGSRSAGHCCCSQGTQTCGDWGQEICAPSPTRGTCNINTHKHTARVKHNLISNTNMIFTSPTVTLKFILLYHWWWAVRHKMWMTDTECEWEWNGSECGGLLTWHSKHGQDLPKWGRWKPIDLNKKTKPN